VELKALQKASFWWRRGRVELYHEHGLGVLLLATAVKARTDFVANV